MLLRAVLLTVGGIYVVAHGIAAWRGRPPAAAGAQLLGARLALVWLLVGALALVTAAGALLSLRRKRPKRTLHLDGLGRRGSAPRDAAPGEAPPSTERGTRQ